VDDAHAALKTEVTQLAQSAGAHASNTGVHITGAERAAWNAKDKSVTGTYQGDGNTQRKITLGFRPRFGIVYGIGVPLTMVEWDMQNCTVYSGFFSSSGNSEGVSADATGFTVTNHAMVRPNGFTIKMNATGTTYVYVAWQ
jgi:hypothetical protein